MSTKRHLAGSLKEALDRLVFELGQTDPIDEIWDHVGQMARDLIALSQEKIQARSQLQAQEQIRQRLNVVLASFWDRHSSLLTFHEVPWNLDRLDPKNLLPDEQQITQIEEALARLGGQLAHHQELRMEQAPSISRYKEVRCLLEEVESQIKISVAEVARLLSLMDSTPSVEGDGEAFPEHALTVDALGGDSSPPRPTVHPSREASETEILRQEPAAVCESACPDPNRPEGEASLSFPQVAIGSNQEAFPAEDSRETTGNRPGDVLPLPAYRGTEAGAPVAEGRDSRPVQPVQSADEFGLCEFHKSAPAMVLEPSEFSRTLWSKVATGDFATVYWLAFGQDPSTQAPVITPWIIKACYLASMVRSPGDAPSTELYSILLEHPRPLEDLAAEIPYLAENDAKLLVALASIRPSLVSPQTGAPCWLSEVRNACPPLNSVLETVLDFASTGIALDANSLLDSQEGYLKEREIGKLTEKAKQWLANQKNSRLSYSPATTVIHRLASDSTDIGRAAMGVAGNRQDQSQFVREVLYNRLSSQRVMIDEISAVARMHATGPNVRKITGAILETLVNRLVEIKRVMETWADETEISAGRTADWRDNQIALFRRAFQAAWSPVSSGPSVTADDSLSSLSLKAVLWRVLQAIETDLLVGNRMDSGSYAIGEDWHRPLRAPLLLVDVVPLTEDGNIPPVLSNDAAQALTGAILTGKRHTDAITRHIERQDFVAARLTLAEIDRDENWTHLNDQIQDQQGEASEAFRRELDGVRGELEKATFDHVLTEHDRSMLEGELLSLDSLERSGYHRYDNLESEITRIKDRLTVLRQERIDSLATIIEDLRQRISQEEGETRQKAEDFRVKAEIALERRDLAVADEYAASAEDILRYGYSSFSDRDRVPLWVFFDKFKARIPELMKALDDDDQAKRSRVRDKLVSGEGTAGLDMRDVPGARHREIELALDAFQLLKRSHGRFESKIDSGANWISAILGYIGFRSPEATRKIVKKSYWHYTAEMSDVGLSPLPHFGSARNKSYDVVVVWDRPNAETIGQILQEAGLVGRCPIVFFMGRMTLRQREDWGNYCYRNQLTVLLIDELLTYFLATVREHRLPICVACSMPWGFANPYTPFGAGNVPPEMFKGRQDVIRKLMDPLEGAIIYGGRQLGKSAILRAIERQFHNPDKRQYVFFDDIRSIGDPQGNQPISDIWRHLRDWSARMRLIDHKVLESPINVSNELQKAFERFPEMRVLVLFDEADNFMEADARREFEEVQRLKKLMDATNRRFKVIFSGLHSVQRYCSIPNHPFAHLGLPVVIGPLDPQAALSLMKEPLEVLGFRFEGEDPAYRILAYTNYQPALIQHFCSELVKRRKGEHPPFSITLRSVEDVYRNPEVRRVMTERFIWTVGLDPRYEALVYAMFIEQSSERDGYRKEFRAREAVECA